MKINKIFLFLLGSFLQTCMAASFIHAGEDKNKNPESIRYLRSPENRLARLDGFLDLAKSQKTRILRILRNEDSSIRAVVEKGDNDIRKILNEEQQEQFDELKPDTEVAPDVQAGPSARLRPVQGMGGERGQRPGGNMGGQVGGQGQGGQRPGGNMGGAGGQRPRGNMGRQTAPAHPPQAGGGQEMDGNAGAQKMGGRQRGYCGDGTCQEIESERGICPDDCDQE